ncbi:class I SAM-dependent methyltransferase [Anthocerotibacter panamensis]|uniref:class I SAM-dependent methyltransferase n=1 Tax=Anthocerotibacter panamensis TaxID=2857077 RepID=UPI001C403605|nr:class I SAM-dependent methyltransferase [Anthocerotibacter panamensis]
MIFDKQISHSNKLEIIDKISKVYTSDYFETIDLGSEQRATRMANVIHKVLDCYQSILRIPIKKALDFGGGKGHLASLMGRLYPTYYYDNYTKPEIEGNYRVISTMDKGYTIVWAIEVIEHMPDFTSISHIIASLNSKGLFVFTTEVSDDCTSTPLKDWWYIYPDAGHIALFSRNALVRLANSLGCVYFYFGASNVHIFYKNKTPLFMNWIILYIQDKYYYGTGPLGKFVRKLSKLVL